MFRENILGQSVKMPEGTPIVSGVDFNDFRHRNITVAELVKKMATMGYQATNLAIAADIANFMVSILMLELLTSLS